MFQFGMAVRDAIANVFNGSGDPVVPKYGVVGNGALLRMYAGAEPGDCSEPSDGAQLCEIRLPSPWLANSKDGGVIMAGVWQGSGAAAAGTGTKATYFRIFDRNGKTCHIQGNITHTAGGGDMTIDNVSIAQNQTVVVSGFSLTAGNA
jgi:hypothetical protein